MKIWKSGFFLFDRRAIPDYMSWRHPSSAIDDPKPPAGSYSQDDVRRLCAHVLKLRDIPEEVLVLSGLSRVWRSQTRDSVIKGSDGNDPIDYPIHSAAIIPTRGNQGGSSDPPTAEGPSTRDSRGKAIMTDATNASSGDASHSWSSVGPVPSF
ncbi:hypothetical protein Tco_1521828 [Tanacetum coccineum]